MKEKCIIAGGGECGGINVEADAFVIAADSGLKLLEKSGITPHMIIGDFDSLGYTPEGKNVITLPVEKDDTDVSVAIKEGIKRGCREFFIFGGTGGREDHTFANYQLLSFLAENSCIGFLFGESWVSTVIKDGYLEFEKGRSGKISVFSLSRKSEGVTIEGLKYNLADASLSSCFPLGVSNEFNGKTAKIAVKNGSLLVMWEDTAANIINYQSSRNFLPFSS